MKKRNEKADAILELAHQSGVVSTADVRSKGIHHEYLRQLCASGELVRVGHGLYTLSDSEITPNHGIIQVSKAVPKGVACLLASLRFHEIGTQAPSQVWIALERRAAYPRRLPLRTRIVRFSGSAFTEGIDEHVLEGVRVRIYNPAKTVADCFKYRNKIGLDVALEALREVLRDQKCSTDDLWKYAKICRVTKTIRPYMEATV
ncbi:MAG: type IV toxin-antitoxin system AbiEi family antitoxin domain-containing protein [Planctomycetota bacterium]|nr:type IV toxin-antitoxin system AbiEi family antitoxin domain-containing protein [Planctomycetota bacterium]